MSFEVFIVLLLLAVVVFAIIRKLFLVAFIIFVVGIAFYTGLAGAFFDLLFSILPAPGGGAEVAQIALLPLLLT